MVDGLRPAAYGNISILTMTHLPTEVLVDARSDL